MVSEITTFKHSFTHALTVGNRSACIGGGLLCLKLIMIDKFQTLLLILIITARLCHINECIAVAMTNVKRVITKIPLSTKVIKVN